MRCRAPPVVREKSPLDRLRFDTRNLFRFYFSCSGVWDQGEQAVLAQNLRRVTDHLKRNTGTLSNVQQGMPSIRKIQHPEAGVDLRLDIYAPSWPVKIPLPELRFAMWVEAEKAKIVFQYVHDRDTEAK